MCDYFVIVTGTAKVHVTAIAEYIQEELEEAGVSPRYREGFREGNWALLDYLDVVVHVFHEPTRKFYSLERLWGDAPVETLSDD